MRAYKLLELIQEHCMLEGLSGSKQRLASAVALKGFWPVIPILKIMLMITIIVTTVDM